MHRLVSHTLGHSHYPHLRWTFYVLKISRVGEASKLHIRHPYHSNTLS